MKGKIRKSTAIVLGTAAAAVGLASHASAQLAPEGTVTYIMSINDDGWGDYTPNSFAIYAIDGTIGPAGVIPNSIAANGNQVDGGIDNFDLHVSGAVPGSLNDDIVNGSTFAAHAGEGWLFAPSYYSLTDAAKTSHKDSFVEAGFTEDALSDDNNSTTVGAGQDTTGTPPSYKHVTSRSDATLIIFGLGQSAGDMLNFAESTTGNNPGIPAGTKIDFVTPYSSPYAGPGTFTFDGKTYLDGLLVADGQYVTGTPPSINLADSLTGLLMSYDEPFDTIAKGYDGAGSSTAQVVITQTLRVPEPAGVGLLGIGAVGLMARRRRRTLEAK
jgi:hypothetical protein